MNDTFTVPQTTLALLTAREEFRSQVYRDTTGHLTAGIGHKLTPSEIAQYPVGTEVPAETLDRWKTNDIGKAYRAAQTQVRILGVDGSRRVTITEDVAQPLAVTLADVLASVNFQLGTGWITLFDETWGLMVRKRYAEAADHVGATKWFRQSPKRVRDLQTALRSLANNNSL